MLASMQERQDQQQMLQQQVQHQQQMVQGLGNQFGMVTGGGANSNDPLASSQDELDPDDIIGIIKIKEGLFIADQIGSQDLEFVLANKVTRVINCAGTELCNFWEKVGVLYLTLNWQDDEKQTLFDSAEKIADEIYRFMEEAVENHESVIIQSVKAQNRACFVVATFIMRRYRWSLVKTLEFINSRRPDLELRQSFLAQLHQHEQKLFARGLGPKTTRWNELAQTAVPDLENEELILRNTYMNSKQGPLADLQTARQKNSPKLVWRDEKKPDQISINNKQQQNMGLTEENRDEDDLINLVNPAKQMNHRVKHASQLVSKLKNSKLHISQKQRFAAQLNNTNQRAKNGKGGAESVRIPTSSVIAASGQTTGGGAHDHSDSSTQLSMDISMTRGGVVGAGAGAAGVNVANKNRPASISAKQKFLTSQQTSSQENNEKQGNVANLNNQSATSKEKTAPVNNANQSQKQNENKTQSAPFEPNQLNSQTKSGGSSQQQQNQLFNPISKQASLTSQKSGASSAQQQQRQSGPNSANQSASASEKRNAPIRINSAQAAHNHRQAQQQSANAMQQNRVAFGGQGQGQGQGQGISNQMMHHPAQLRNMFYPTQHHQNHELSDNPAGANPSSSSSQNERVSVPHPHRNPMRSANGTISSKQKMGGINRPPMTHQVRDISPLTSHMSNKFGNKNGVNNQNGVNVSAPSNPQNNSTSANSSSQSAVNNKKNNGSANSINRQTGSSGQNYSASGAPFPAGSDHFEPKKRELTQKIAPKMVPLPMTKDLTNLPNHGATSSTSANMKKMSSNGNGVGLNERPRSSQIASHSSTFGSSSKGVGHPSAQNNGSSRLTSGGMMGRGFSPSLQQKSGDLGTRSRLPLGSGGYKRSALNSSYQHANEAGSGGQTVGVGGNRQVNLGSGGQGAARPGSAPKLRNSHTPNAQEMGGQTGGHYPTSHLLRGSGAFANNSNGSTLNNSMSMHKQLEGMNHGSGNTTSSKNMLNSFRNGPIKITGGHGSGFQSGGLVSQAGAMKARAAPNKFVNSNSHTNHMHHHNNHHAGATNSGGSVANRPASAPAKRPPSPGNHALNSNQNQNGTSSSQTRVKYAKNTTNSNLSGNKGIGGGMQVGQVRGALNQSLRGFSPSKPRWKLGGSAAGGNSQGSKTAAYSGAGHHTGGNSGPGVGVNGSTFGHGNSSSSGTTGANPNVYTRSTKHTPSHAR